MVKKTLQPSSHLSAAYLSSTGTTLRLHRGAIVENIFSTSRRLPSVLIFFSSYISAIFVPADSRVLMMAFLRPSHQVRRLFRLNLSPPRPHFLNLWISMCLRTSFRISVLCPCPPLVNWAREGQPSEVDQWDRAGATL
jgi:hypothetical protein